MFHTGVSLFFYVFLFLIVLRGDEELSQLRQKNSLEVYFRERGGDRTLPVGLSRRLHDVS